MIISSNQLTMKRWVLFTSYGWFIGILLVVVLALIGELLFKTGEESGGQAAVGIGMGAGVGILQWMALRKYLATSYRFFWCTLIGFSFSFILRDIVAPQIEFLINTSITIPLAVILGAFISGWLQYNFVFKKLINGAINWIFYSTIGWLIATVITIAMPMLKINFGENFPKILILVIALLFLSIGGPILGYITGRFIVTKINFLKEHNSTNTQE